MEQKILAGIVLYNPDIERLLENIKAAISQVDCVVLIENGSTSFEYKQHLVLNERLVLIENPRGMGIAYALNQVMAYGKKNGFEWVLTLDQDSVIIPGLIATYREYTGDNVAIVSCNIIDRNFLIAENCKNVDSEEINWCITSASLTSVKAWEKVGGFDSSMFIDWVDTDICISFRNAGYKIIKTYKTKLIHELGTNTSIKKFFKWDVYVLNRPAFRYYYVARNLIYLGRKHKNISVYQKFKESLLTLFSVLYFEGNKYENFKAITKGIIDGFIMPVSKPRIDDVLVEISQNNSI